MADFSQAIEAQLRGATVRVSTLVMFDFASGPMRLWPGFGDLLAAGHIWKGLGNLGVVSSMSAGPGQVVEEMTFQLFAEQAWLENIREDSEESAGREVNVFLQFFDIRQEDELGNWVEWQPLDDPMQIFWGTMGPLTIERPEADADAASARFSRTISVIASNAFVNRARPSFAYYSDRDQKARSPGDNMFINAHHMADLKVKWPHFSS